MDQNDVGLRKLQIALCAGMIDYLSDILEEIESSSEEGAKDDDYALEEREEESYGYYPDWEEDEKLGF